MKKIICFILVLTLSVNTIQYVYADTSSDSSDSSPTATPEPTFPPPPSTKIFEFLNALMGFSMDPNSASKLGLSLFNGLSDSDKEKIEEEASKDNNVTTDGNYYYITNNFFKTVNNQIQNSVHTLDGYYLIEPNQDSTFLSVVSSNFTGKYKETNETLANEFNSKYSTIFLQGRNLYTGIDISRYYYIDSKAPFYVYNCDSSLDNNNYFYTLDARFCLSSGISIYNHNLSSDMFLNYFQKENVSVWGVPFKLFYSLDDVKNYINKGRTYSPKFPEINIKIPVNYVNNNVTLPSIDFGDFTATGKSETEIQDYLDSVLKKYLDKLQTASSATPTPTPGFTDGEPTPTPTPGTGGGDFTDQSPTPTPGAGGGTGGSTTVDMTDTNNWLKKIYNWLVSFGKSQDALFEKIMAYIKNNDGKLDDVIKSIDNIKIPASPDVNVDFTDTNVALKKIQDLITSFQKSHDSYAEKVVSYLEKNNGKLDDIITAIDALSKGNTETEANGCKYDFTALSQFLTETWNESDKKFDTMIELLEKNNEYQKNLVNLLGDIKKELIKENVINTFKNRSSQTAEKAKEKFPTSLPWDIAFVVNSMSAEPQEINITIPVKVDSLNVQEELNIDITDKEWEKLAKLCRYLLSLLFILYMVHLTRKLFFNKGDDD
nr:hypothetical protein [uncultured Blautia sp.]